MALTDKVDEMQERMAKQVAQFIEERNQALIDRMPDEESKQQVRNGYRLIGDAVATVLPLIMEHVQNNATVNGMPGVIE